MGEIFAAKVEAYAKFVHVFTVFNVRKIQQNLLFALLYSLTIWYVKKKLKLKFMNDRKVFRCIARIPSIFIFSGTHKLKILSWIAR